MTIPVVRDAATVDAVIQNLGNRKPLLAAPRHPQIDAMIIVLGDRLEVAEILQRWPASPGVLCGALTARAWLIGDLDDLPDSH